MADPVSTIWPHYISDFLNDEGVKDGITTVAILYSTNDFTGTQATALKGFFERDKKVKIVYYQGVPTTHVQLHGADQQHRRAEPRRGAGTRLCRQ